MWLDAVVHTFISSTREAKQTNLSWVQGQPLLRELQDSQSYIVRPFVKKKKSTYLEDIQTKVLAKTFLKTIECH